MSRLQRHVAFALYAAAAGGCAVGPTFTPPPLPVSPPFGAVDRAGTLAGPRTSDGSPDPAWWHAFNDAELDRLEARTRQGNLDLQAGVLRIVAARTQVQAARAQGLPTLNASASYNREQLGLAGILKAQGTPTGNDSGLVSALTRPINLYQLGFDASWELDLFGRVSHSVEAAEAQTQQTIAARDDMLVSLQAEVAQTYLQLRGAQRLRAITTDLIAEQHEILELTMNRRAHGLAEESEVESARGQESSLRAELPQYELSMAVSRHALAVLLGETPDALDEELRASVDLPAVPSGLSVGIPSELARRRPDIRQAEAGLHSATAEVGVSIASLYPAVSLSGTFGLRHTSAHYLFDWASKFYTAGPTISVPLFRGGSLIANVKLSRAQAGVAALEYRKTVLGALQEVEDGLVALNEDAQRQSALEETVTADQRAFDVVKLSYVSGLTTYIGVLTQQLQTNQAQVQLAQASLSELTDVVKLYKALGGGWEAETQ